MRSLFITSLLILSQAGAAQSAANVDALTFRSIFSVLVDPKDKDPDRVNHLVYAPIPELLSSSDEKFVTKGFTGEQVARGTMRAMQKAYAASNAAAFYNYGKSQVAVQPDVDLEVLSKNLKDQDVLMVVVPGIFGEFIKGRAFEEIFEKDSAYKREFEAALDAQTRAQIGAKDRCDNHVRMYGDKISVCDTQEQLSRLTLEAGNKGGRDVHMSELLNVGSTDDETGAPVTRVVLFQMDAMTLESLGRQQDKAAIFNRRLEKFFKIMNHTPKNIVFVGYSRGTAFALEMLDQAKRKNKQWLANVRGVVSLGGVVFGSALADDVLLNKQNPANCQLQLESLFEQILTELPDLNKSRWDERNRAFYLRNMAGWYRFFVAMGKVSSKAFKDGQITCDQIANLKRDQDKLIDKEELKFALVSLMRTAKAQGGADADFGRQMISNLAVKFGFVGDVANLDLKKTVTDFANCLAEKAPLACVDAFLPDVKKYNTDIRRFKSLVLAARQGVEELSTDSRLKWWKEHTIPTQGIRYYSVSGTMAAEADLVRNKYGFNPGSPDDMCLADNWRSFTGVQIKEQSEYDGVNLNDSQVAIYKTVFWPNLIASLNSANAGVKFTPLAVVGTHHWGMALPIVTEVSSTSRYLKRNPFPREQLMNAIALSVAQDIKVDSEKQVSERGE